ncbi:DUF1351 domain-containing protein [Treponema sp. OMZ 857]|uniref:DUF1351 domain-containing protein n=1 Tax=Treponema sp. OMZ 857 TaxID=1643513 RepID=UPI0020A2CB96|nr:DUF1351 domain-containing protein [Treponema sp. OMZ 857]UTC44818.1 DUF1351 domain-containing protein [Treponema sp. OMZ 857]
MKKKDVFTFDERFHVYRLNGEIIPSVTKIICTVAGKDLSHIPPEILKKAAERGTAIHKEIETGVIQSVEAKWIEQNIVRASSKFEQQFYHTIDDFTYAGTADIVASDTLFDIKTQKEADFLSWTLQLNLYNLFFKKKCLKVLYTPNTGNFSVVDIPFLSMEQIQEVISTYLQGAQLREDFMNSKEGKKELVEVPPLELTLKVVEQNIGTLNTNAEQLLELVKKRLAYYSIDRYSVDNIAAAKKDKAELNNAAKLLNAERIRIEKEFMKPIETFKTTVLETVNLINECSAKIDGIVKEVEQKEKDNKKAIIIEYFESLHFSLVDFDMLFSPKWLNKTTKLKDIQDEIRGRIEKIQADLSVLDRIGEAEAKQYYLSTLNLDAALAKADEIKANRERLAALEKAQAEQKEHALSEKERLDMEAAGEEIPLAYDAYCPSSTSFSDSAQTETEPQEREEKLQVTFMVIGTADQLVDLEAYMKKAQLRYTFQ